MREQTYLATSLAVTLAVAVLGIGTGLLSGSHAIAFDGIYALADAGMTLLALFVSRLILRATAPGGATDRLQARFNMGVWHLEPLVVAFDGLLLMGIALYAFVNGLMSLTEGGQQVALGPALAYATVTFAACTGMAAFGRRQNRRFGSDLVALDIKGWTMSACITAALLVAFALGLALDRQGAAHLVPYVDPLVLALVSLAIVPVPLREVRQAIREILLITPQDLRAEVEEVARRLVAEQGFVGHRAYVAEIGRAVQIELWFVVPPGAPPRPLEHWDALRDRVAAAIGGAEQHRWLTVTFTADPEWAV